MFSTIRLIFQSIAGDSKLSFMDSGMMVQLKGHYALIVSHVSQLLPYVMLTGLYAFIGVL